MPKKQRKAYKHNKTSKIMYSEPGMAPLYWIAAVTDAKESVQITSTIKEALEGKPGSVFGCHLSLCADENKEQFPHEYIMAAFTKATCLVITEFFPKKKKIKGKYVDCHAVRYAHHMGKYVDLNDEDKEKEVFKTWPELANMKFSLFKPQSDREYTPRPGYTAPKGETTGEKSPKLIKGALQRAEKAGLVSGPVATALRNLNVAKR